MLDFSLNKIEVYRSVILLKRDSTAGILQEILWSFVKQLFCKTSVSDYFQIILKNTCSNSIVKTFGMLNRFTVMIETPEQHIVVAIFNCIQHTYTVVYI